MTFIIKCKPCGGNGHYGIDTADVCKVCRGRGQIHVSGKEEDYQTCQICSGNGHHGIDSVDTCRVCKGLGIVTKIYAE